MRASAKDLRFHSKEILNAVSRGEEVIITFRGRPKAKIVPLRDEARSGKADPRKLFGIWRDNPEVADVDGFIRSVRRGRFP
ncbi:MAG: type II toxin-antitoxin system prevent-host-death family antitoxin [Candidatus Aminicenantes bacterium]|nr:type II toxin-antitoxin system prevent-host-death family antitoxin [Candidatus Aminicenantes bacterium]